jgi:hypothetical protein
MLGEITFPMYGLFLDRRSYLSCCVLTFPSTITLNIGNSYLLGVRYKQDGPLGDKFTSRKTSQLRAKAQAYPAYSFDLTHSDYHPFIALKQNVGDHKFKNDREMGTVAKKWLITHDN